MSKPPSIFSPRWWRILWLITREFRRGVKKGRELRERLDELERLERERVSQMSPAAQLRYWQDKAASNEEYCECGAHTKATPCYSPPRHDPNSGRL